MLLPNAKQPHCLNKVPRKTVSGRHFEDISRHERDAFLAPSSNLTITQLSKENSFYLSWVYNASALNLVSKRNVKAPFSALFMTPPCGKARTLIIIPMNGES